MPATPHALSMAAAALQAGDVVVLPTETVYGLSADASNSSAVQKIYALKSRPHFNPLIVHGASIEHLQTIAIFDERALNVASSFWPAPLTLILPLKPKAPVSDLVTAGLNTVAVRIPAHKIFQAVIKEAGLLIAAPSANKSGEVSPTAPHHVARSLGDDCPLIIADGACAVGLESTILDLTETEPFILRYGGITADDLEATLGASPKFYQPEPDHAIKSPGQLLKHYAPQTKLRLNAVDVAPDEALLAFGSTKFMGIRGGGYAHTLPEERFLNLSEGGDLTEAAHNLFSYLRKLDETNASSIAVMPIPNRGIGFAINDRLSRAAKG